MPYVWTYIKEQQTKLPYEGEDVYNTIGRPNSAQWYPFFNYENTTSEYLIKTKETYDKCKAQEKVEIDKCTIALTNVTNKIIDLLEYLPPDIRSTLNALIKTYIESMPFYVEDLKTHNKSRYIREYQYVRHCKRRWGKRYRRANHWHNKTVSVLDGYTFTMNTNFFASITKYQAITQALSNDISNNILNNCENKYTLLNADGLKECGIYDLIDKLRFDVKPVLDMSNYVMTKLKNTKDFPQYAQAKAVDDELNKWNLYDPMDVRSPINNGYAKDRQDQILAKIWDNGNLKKALLSLYDFCKDNQTHIGVDQASVPVCPQVKDDYMKSAQQCGQAIQMSKTYQYGTDKLTNLWTDISNSIPGNMKTEGTLILNTGNNSCKKWVDMFNVWEKMEEEALATPCNPERPIENTNNKALKKLASDWNTAASDRIKQLKIRLKKIQKYIKNYPNILHLKKEDIVLAPSSMDATALIKKNYSQINDGESPNQHLEMIIPNGTPGKQGKMGIDGILGSTGRRGIPGPMGKTGDGNVPSFYNIIR